jgi:Mu transposase, C-terminal
VFHQGIKLHGRYFWHDDLILHMGHQVEVRFGDELGRVLVFAGGKFICEALNDPAMQMGATRESLAQLHRKKAQAKKTTDGYLAAQGVLRNSDKYLAELAAQARSMKIVSLPPPPTPAGVRAIPKMLPDLDQAAAALASASTRPSRPTAAPEAPLQAPPARGRHPLASAQAGAGARRADDWDERLALLKELGCG